MKLHRIIGLSAAVGALLITQSAMAATETINFGSLSGSTINFEYQGSGHTDITFLKNNNNHDLKVTSISGFSGTDLLTGLYGDITGTFYYLDSEMSGSTSAPVHGSGQFAIHDNNNVDFTAALTWTDVYDDTTSGNMSGHVTLGSFDYSGANAQLIQLKNSVNGNIEVWFDFGHINLNSLSSGSCDNGGCDTSYTGAITATSTATPEPGSYAFLMVGLLAAFGLVRRFRTA